MNFKLKLVGVISGLGLTMSACSYATIVDDFGQIKEAIAQGYKPILLLSGSCLNPSMNISASYAPAAVVITDAGLATSDLHFTLNDPLSVGSPAYEYTLYQIAPSGQVKMTTTVFDPSFKPIGIEPVISCALGQGFDVAIN